MTPQEIALNMAAAHNYCKGDKCLYRTKCGKLGESCPLKEVAMILRSQEQRIASLETMLTAAEETVEVLNKELAALKKINKSYNVLVNAFKDGYRPPRVTKGGKPRRPVKKRNPVEMDGDEKYALPRQSPPDLPLNII